MDENLLKARTDLDLRPESADPESPVIVKDPITKRFYRFTAVQADVLRSMDGKTSPAAIAQTVSAARSTEVTEAQVKEFTGKLLSLLLLDHTACWARLEKAGRRKKRLIENLLAVKIFTFNPDALLTRLERRLRFAFSPLFAWFVAGTVFAALAVSILNWESLFFSLGKLFTLYSIPLIVVVAFAVMTIHEFGHGVALKHYGGKVEEMGLMVMYFIPAFYCNLNDAWMLKKRERLRVTFAGGYVQFLVWALATLLWRLLAQETFASRVCLVAIAFAGIQTLFNFNPLIRLDGYYLLSDWLGIPNLRAKAFSHLGHKLKALAAGSATVRPAAAGPRERRIYFYYGTAAFLFTAALLWVMLGRLGGWMVREYRTWGAVAFVVLCLMLIPAHGGPKEPPAAKMPKGAALRLKKLPQILIVLAVLAAAGFIPWELKVAGDFTIQPQKEVSVTPQVDGTLKSIRVDEGDAVRAGDMLAELQNLKLNDEYENTKGELASMRAALDLLHAGTRPEEIERARRTVETKRAELTNAMRVEQERLVLMDTVAKREAELANAKTMHERSQKLLAQGLIAKNEADRDQTAYEVRRRELAEARGQLNVLEERTDRTIQVKRKELEQAQSELKILEAGSRKESIRAVEADVSKLEEKLNILTQQLEHLTVRSPIDGVVATPYLRNRIGEYVERGSGFCKIVDVARVGVDMPVPEKEIADVRAGALILLKARGYPKRSFQARVKSISPVAFESGGERKVTIQGELDNTEGILRPGMTGVGKILCGRRTIAELVTRRGVRWLRTEFWEYLP